MSKTARAAAPGNVMISGKALVDLAVLAKVLKETGPKLGLTVKEQLPEHYREYLPAPDAREGTSNTVPVETTTFNKVAPPGAQELEFRLKNLKDARLRAVLEMIPACAGFLVETLGAGMQRDAGELHQHVAGQRLEDHRRPRAARAAVS